MEIRSKREFVELYHAGVLGNRLRVFKDPYEACLSGAKEIGFREASRNGGGGLHRVVPYWRAIGEYGRWRREHRDFYMDEAAPDADVQLQGEICRGLTGWQGLLGIRTGLRMRQAMAAGKLRPCTAATVLYFLDRYVDPSSREDINAIFDLYPDATVELASYPYDLGCLPNRNTIIWEVRNY